jgi:predicted ester cyclase
MWRKSGTSQGGWPASHQTGRFTDESLGVTYRGPNELGRTVEVYSKAFPDMHRELYEVIVQGDVVIVELSLNGTHKGPLELPNGIVPPSGKRMKAPCCDVFRLKNVKFSRFTVIPSYPSWLPALSYDRMASLLAPYENSNALEVARTLDMKVEDLLRRAAA